MQGNAPASTDLFRAIATGCLKVFPNAQFDSTLNPEVLFGPDPATQPTTWGQAKDGFNFGRLELNRDGELTAAIVNTAGQTQFSFTLSPQ